MNKKQHKYCMYAHSSIVIRWATLCIFWGNEKPARRKSKLVRWVFWSKCFSFEKILGFLLFFVCCLLLEKNWTKNTKRLKETEIKNSLFCQYLNVVLAIFLKENLIFCKLCSVGKGNVDTWVFCFRMSCCTFDSLFADWINF